MHPDEGTCREKTPSGKNLHNKYDPTGYQHVEQQEYLFRNEIRRR